MFLPHPYPAKHNPPAHFLVRTRRVGRRPPSFPFWPGSFDIERGYPMGRIFERAYKGRDHNEREDAVSWQEGAGLRDCADQGVAMSVTGMSFRARF